MSPLLREDAFLAILLFRRVGTRHVALVEGVLVRMRGAGRFLIGEVSSYLSSQKQLETVEIFQQLLTQL
jgi:predicted ATPase